MNFGISSAVADLLAVTGLQEAPRPWDVPCRSVRWWQNSFADEMIATKFYAVAAFAKNRR